MIQFLNSKNLFFDPFILFSETWSILRPMPEHDGIKNVRFLTCWMSGAQWTARKCHFSLKKIHFSFHSKTATFSSTFQKFRWQIRLLADKNHNLLLRKCNGTTLNQKMYYSLPILTCPFLYIGLFHLYRSSFVVKNGLVNEISLKKKLF